MRIRLAVPERHVGPRVLDAALEAVTRADEALLQEGSVPPASHVIGRGLVRWRPEPPGTPEHFDLASTVVNRRWGDCDDLAPYWAAELRATGKDPGARAVVRRSGPHKWHAVVLRSDGSIDDPSRAAGMGQRPAREASLVGSAVMPTMHHATRPAWGIAPWRGGWASRADLPLLSETRRPVAIVGTAWSRDPLEAASRALQGACVVGEACDGCSDDHIASLAGLEGILHGMPFDEVVGELDDRGYNVVGIIPGIMAASSMFGGGGKGGPPGGGGGGAAGSGGGGAAASGRPGTAAPQQGGSPFSAATPAGPIIVKF